jgi:hypothetical protein
MQLKYILSWSSQVSSTLIFLSPIWKPLDYKYAPDVAKQNLVIHTLMAELNSETGNNCPLSPDSCYKRVQYCMSWSQSEFFQLHFYSKTK